MKKVLILILLLAPKLASACAGNSPVIFTYISWTTFVISFFLGILILIKIKRTWKKVLLIFLLIFLCLVAYIIDQAMHSMLCGGSVIQY